MKLHASVPSTWMQPALEIRRRKWLRLKKDRSGRLGFQVYIVSCLAPTNFPKSGVAPRRLLTTKSDPESGPRDPSIRRLEAGGRRGLQGLQDQLRIGPRRLGASTSTWTNVDFRTEGKAFTEPMRLWDPPSAKRKRRRSAVYGPSEAPPSSALWTGASRRPRSACVRGSVSRHVSKPRALTQMSCPTRREMVLPLRIARVATKEYTSKSDKTS